MSDLVGADAKAPAKSTARPAIFYGWWILAAGCVVWVLNGMTAGYGMGVFYKRLTDDMGWTKTELAGAISLSRLESGLLGPFGGLLVDRLGPTKVMLFGVTAMSAGMILLARVDSLIQFYIVYISFVVIGNSLSYLIPIDTTVANWFRKKRGMAFGLLRGAIAVGAAGVFLLSLFIDAYGWRTAFVATGIATFIVGIPAALIMRSRPEAYGMLPDGETARSQQGDIEMAKAGQEAGPAVAVAAPAGPIVEEDIGMTANEALKSPAFYAISFGFGLRMMVTTAVTLHAVSLVEDLGYSSSAAAGVLGTIGFVSLIGRLTGGWFCDRFGTKNVAIVSVITLAVGSVVLAFAQNMLMVMIFIAIYAPSYGGQVAAMPAMSAAYFGRKAYGTITGLSGLGQTLGAIIGPVFAAYIFDVTGSYRLAFLVFAVLLLLAACLFLTLKRPRYN